MIGLHGEELNSFRKKFSWEKNFRGKRRGGGVERKKGREVRIALKEKKIMLIQLVPWKLIPGKIMPSNSTKDGKHETFSTLHRKERQSNTVTLPSQRLG